MQREGKNPEKAFRERNCKKYREGATSIIHRVLRGIMRVVRSEIQQTNQQLKHPECASRLKKRTERAQKKNCKNQEQISEILYKKA